MRLARIALALTFLTAMTVAQDSGVNWYKFNKNFIKAHYAADSAIGVLRSNSANAAKNVHKSSCGANDGELHIGIAGSDIVWTNPQQALFSAPADDSDREFGVVAEPVNLSSATKKLLAEDTGSAMTFTGYFRLWNEGHDRGAVHDSNPHHVLEVHPAWAASSISGSFSDSKSIKPMPGYEGYGASKFRPMLTEIKAGTWPLTYEDEDFLYVGIKKAENFYQLPVQVKGSKAVTGGTQFSVDVFSDVNHTTRIFQNLQVIALADSVAANQLSASSKTYLLGIFSVNLNKAMEIAKGHNEEHQVAATAALEFFDFGRPVGQAVKNGHCDLEDEEE